MTYRNLEFHRVLASVSHFCGFEQSKIRILNEKVGFRYLQVKNELAKTKEALQFLRLGEQLQFNQLTDTTMSYLKLQKNQFIIGIEIKNIAQNLLVGQIIKDKLSKTEFTYLRQLSDSLANTTEIRQYIYSKITEYGEIKEDASPTLKAISHQIKKLQTIIDQKLKNFIVDNTDIIMEDIVVERNQRNCVLVVSSQKNKKQGMIHGETASGLAVYFEPIALVTLNNELFTLKQKLEDEQYKILQDLNQQLRVNVEQYIKDLETLQLLDCTMAKAKYTQAINGVIPTINKDSHMFYYKNARNPLINSKNVIENTYQLDEKYHTIIISGSNTGGKTVTLKTIGLFVCMAMCGIGVSCDEATMPMYDRLLVDIGDEQSIEQSLSTFSSHIKRISEFTKLATRKTLILLDELGSGSDPNDSQNLAMAFLDYFRSLNATLLVTTHFEKIKQYAKLHDDILSASVGFDFDLMRPTYKYIPYRTGTSNALLIAEKLGVDANIIHNAKQYEDKNEERDLFEKVNNEYQQLQQAKEELQLAQQQFEKEKAVMLEQLKQEELKHQMKLQQVEKSFNDKLTQLYQSLSDELQQIKSTPTISKIKQHQNKIQEAIIQETVVENIVVGDYVEMISLRYFGTVEKIQGSKYTINTNGISLTTKLNDLRKVTKPVATTSKSQHSYKKATSVSEVNVIGMTVDEAWAIIDKMLDDALLAKRYQFTIIHGSGTGKLRAGIHERLKKLKFVKKFQLTNNLGATEVFFV